jgi:hypothetical protein
VSQSTQTPTVDSGLMTRIDAYCERTDYEFWAEPVNALTNGAFIVAAIIGLILARRSGRLDVGTGILAGLIFAIGIGSFLFHTIATRWAAIADVLPIQLFIIAYLILAMRRFLGLPWWTAGLIGIAFIPAQFVFGQVLGAILRDVIGSSVGYLPAATALAITGIILLIRRHPAGWPLAMATGLFAVSLTFRTLDGPLCDVLPLGTHFVWHILNGILLGWLLLTMIRHGQVPAKAPAR